ncbi:CinA family protein [Roseivivax sp. CAU 1761]
MSPEAARRVLDAARAAGLRIATAESCTGGMIAAALTDLPGSSAVFEFGFVTYANAAKVRLLGVDPATLERCGAVSEEVAREMALGARRVSGADIAVAVSGIAGPGGSEHKPEGRVCFGLAHPHECRAETVDFGALGRARVREAATLHALGLVAAALGDR